MKRKQWKRVQYCEYAAFTTSSPDHLTRVVACDKAGVIEQWLDDDGNEVARAQQRPGDPAVKHWVLK